MADIKLLAQGLTDNHEHFSVLNQLLQLKGATEILISVAFARKSGVDLLRPLLESRKDIANVYVGIRNGVTSVQAILAMLKIGIHPYVIDVATTQRLYHPKIYAAFSSTKVELVIGSANLTKGGLNNNYEASTVISLDPCNGPDGDYIATVKAAFCGLEKRFPDNVTQLSKVKAAVKLFREGLLEDERIIKRQAPNKVKTKDAPVPPKPMPSTAKKTSPALRDALTPKRTKKFAGSYVLVWESKGLTERDLNIPTGENTAPTGSMYFKKGLMKDIDQRHYFRNDVFDGLSWQPDPSPQKKHLERAVADFEIIIAGVSYGVYQLKLTHNSDTHTKTYLQNNAMTQIHWGQAKQLIAKPALLDSRVSLHRRGKRFFRLSIS
jgi:HKD family nuclease